MSEAFNPDYLRQHLRPLAAAEADAAVLAYQAYYGLDLRSRHPRLQARLGSMAVDGRRLAVQAWLLPEARGSLLLMHGYYDHMGLYRHVVDWALGMGFSVLACDLPGHGLSEGERASIRDFAEYQAVFKGLLGQAAELDLAAPWHLCGQSTGGAILLDYLLHGGERPELGETILLAPLVRPRAWGWSKLSYRLLSPFVDSIPRRFGELQRSAVPRLPPRARSVAATHPADRLGRRADPLGAAHRAGASACPEPLVVQGESDETVDWRHGLKVLREKFDEPRILLLEEARHHLANESEGLRRRYFDFLSDALGPEFQAPRRSGATAWSTARPAFSAARGRLVAAAGRRLGEVHVLGEFRVGEIAVDIQQGVLQVRADLLHQALALAFQQLAGLSAAKQAGEARKHLAEAVGGDPARARLTSAPASRAGRTWARRLTRARRGSLAVCRGRPLLCWSNWSRRVASTSAATTLRPSGDSKKFSGLALSGRFSRRPLRARWSTSAGAKRRLLLSTRVW